MKLIKSCALLAVATALFSTPKKHEEPSTIEKAAHIITHPSEILTGGETPQDPKVLKDVCPECNKNHQQPPKMEHVKQIIEEAAKSSQANWAAVKDKASEAVGSAADTAKQAAYAHYPHKAEEHTGGAWETIKEGVGSVKDKLVGSDATKAADAAKHASGWHTHGAEEHTGGAWETLKDGVGSVKDKLVGESDAARLASDAARTGGAWESLKDGVGTVKDKLIGGSDAAKAASDAAKYAAQHPQGNVKDKILGGTDVVSEPVKHSHYPRATEEVCVICRMKHAQERAGGAWESLKEGVETMKDKLVGGAKPVDTTPHTLEEIKCRAIDMLEHPELYMHDAKEGMSDLAHKAADTVHPYSSRVSDAIRPSTDKDACPDCHKHDSKHAGGAWETLKEGVETVKDKLAGGAKPVDTTQQSLDEVRHRAVDMITNPEHYVHGAKEGMTDLANKAADAVHPYSARVSDAIRPSSDKVSDSPDQMKDVCPECHKHDSSAGASLRDAVTKPLKDLKHSAEAVGDDVTSGVSDAMRDLRYGAEHMATRATDAVKTGTEDVKHKVADSIPDVSMHGIRDRVGDMTHKVANTVTKPFHHLKEGVDEAGHRVADTASSIKEGAENAKDRVSDAASSLLHGGSGSHSVGQRAHHGMPNDWYSKMIDFKESIEEQMREITSSGPSDRVSYVQQNMEKVNGSWFSYLNDNGKEYLDVQLGEGVDAHAVDPLVAINLARQSHGMPARNDLADVKVQIHQREKPHFFVRTTRVLPNGVWTRYENDNGAEMITEGHVAKKDVTESSLEKTREDKHPLLNMFRRTFGLPELVDKDS